MKKFTIGLDLDSTLNNFEEVWIDRYNELYEDTLTPEDITTWNPEDIVKPECGTKIHDIYKEPGFFRFLKPREQAQEVVRHLSRHFEIDVVTAYHGVPSSCADKVAFIETYFPEINPDNIIFCNDKSKYRGQFLVDDAIHNIKAFKGISVLFDQPWNRSEGYIYRMKGWMDVFNFFEIIRIEGGA